MLLATDEHADAVADIVVVGVGGSGNNAINRMIEMNVAGVKYIAMNTDKQTLMATKADMAIQLGEKVTAGLGAGADPEKGRLAAEENADEILEHLQGRNMVFVTAGMGGGTGTGAAPVIARIAKEEAHCLTVGVVNTPFSFENRPILERAEKGVEELQKYVDALIVIPNDNIYAAGDGKGGKVPMPDAMRLANEVLMQSVQGITDIISKHGDVNRDFADVARVMRDKGLAHIGIGYGKGDDKALEAVRNAVESPLLNTTIETASDVLLNIIGVVTPDELKTIMDYVRSIAGENLDILYGMRSRGDDGELLDPEECQVTLIATGMDAPVVHSSTKMTSPTSYRNSAAGRTQRPPRYTGVSTAPSAQRQPITQPILEEEPEEYEAPQQQPTSIFDRPPVQNSGAQYGTRQGTDPGFGTSNLGRVNQGGGVSGNTTRMRRLEPPKDGEWKMPSFMGKGKKKDE